MTTPSNPCAAALAELVAVEDLLAQMMATESPEHHEQLYGEVSRRREPAWEAARAVLAADKLQTEDQGSQQQRAPDAVLIGGVKHLSAAWQPIETAPKDGTYFLMANQWGVWVGTYQPRAVSGYVFDDPWRSMMLNHWHIRKDAAYNAATNWMPLPEPPSQPKCDDSQQCSPEARYDEVSHGLTSLTLKCRLCGGIRRSDWD